MDPETQLIFVFSSGGIPLGVPPMGVGGPGCFPLAPGFVVGWSSMRSAVIIAQKTDTMVSK